MRCALPLVMFLAASGCAAGGVQQVARWEADGDLPALRRALLQGDADTRRAAAEAIERYAAYSTSRPAMLATLQRAQVPEAQAAARRLIGRPPIAAPDPAGGPAAPVVIYFYRPFDDGPGPALWFAIDGADVVRLQPGRFYRYETSTGLRQLHCHLPPDEEGPQKDMHHVLSVPVPGVYFVRHRVGRKEVRPSFDVMPVDPAVRMLRTLRPVPEQDVAEAERRRLADRHQGAS